MGNQAPHLCGTIRGMASACPYLFETGKEPERDLISGKQMQPYALYCGVGARPRKLGNLSDWTGLTPKWCPIRQAWEADHGQGQA